MSYVGTDAMIIIPIANRIAIVHRTVEEETETETEKETEKRKRRGEKVNMLR